MWWTICARTGDPGIAPGFSGIASEYTVPFRTRRAAASLFCAVMKFAAPRSSSGPQRPQFPIAARAPGTTVLANPSLPSRRALLDESLRERRPVHLAALRHREILGGDLLEVAAERRRAVREARAQLAHSGRGHRGNPSARSAMMLRWICAVPP